MGFASPKSLDQGGGSTTDLTAPASILTPETLTAGTTSLGSTSVGSWSASVTVTCTGVDSSGSPAPTMTPSGSGAGPYTVSIASGLSDGETYTYRIRGTGADEQVADTYLTVAVAAAASSGFTTILDSQTLDDQDFEAAGPGTGTVSNGLAYEYEDLGGAGAATCEISGGVFRCRGGASGGYSGLHIDLGADTAKDAVFLCAKVTMAEDSPGNGYVLFMLGDGTADVNPEGAFQHATWSTTSARNRFANSSGFTYFTAQTVTAADTESYLVRMSSVGTGGWSEVYDGSTRPGVTDTADSSREAGGRSSTSDDRRYLTIIANVDFDLDILVARQSEAP